MYIKSVEIKAERYSVNPILNVCIRYEYERGLEIPIAISGRLNNQDGKVLAELNENKLSSDRDFGLRTYTRNHKELYRKGNIQDSFYLELSASLSSLSINAIESRRNQNPDKSITLHIELIAKIMVLEVDQKKSEFHDFIEIKKQKQSENVKISQSDWVSNFSEELGIGKFILIELRIPNKDISSPFWQNKYAELVSNLEKMQTCLQSGDWEKAISTSRMFFENFKFGASNKKGVQVFKNELDKVLRNQNYSEEGIQNFYDGIWKFFDFASKYHHETNRLGNYQPIPISTPEDAYFIYNLAVGLLNMITKKITRN